MSAAEHAVVPGRGMIYHHRADGGPVPASTVIARAVELVNDNVSNMDDPVDQRWDCYLRAAAEFGIADTNAVRWVAERWATRAARRRAR